MIFYFTATGNCLYTARKIAEATGEKTMSIPAVLRGGIKQCSDKIVGIVCPVYGGEPPYMVREFLDHVKISADYFFVVATYGRSPGIIAHIMRNLAQKSEVDLKYLHTVRTADNYLPAFDMEKERQSGFVAAMDKQLQRICADITARRRRIERVRLKDRMIYNGYRFAVRTRRVTGWKSIKFSATENCNGCGLCAKVCPSDCISIRQGKAAHISDNCQVCMACIHVCPRRAVSMSMPEANPSARYIHPQITVTDLIAANGSGQPREP